MQSAWITAPNPQGPPGVCENCEILGQALQSFGWRDHRNIPGTEISIGATIGLQNPGDWLTTAQPTVNRSCRPLGLRSEQVFVSYGSEVIFYFYFFIIFF